MYLNTSLNWLHVSGTKGEQHGSNLLLTGPSRPSPLLYSVSSSAAPTVAVGLLRASRTPCTLMALSLHHVFPMKKNAFSSLRTLLAAIAAC